MAAEKDIASYTTSIGNKILFNFKDGSIGYGIYNLLTGAKISGSTNAPATFIPTKLAKVIKFTTANLKNLYSLLPKNFIIDGVLKGDFKSIIQKAVSFNKDNILNAAKSKIKNLLGIFTIPAGILKGNKVTSVLSSVLNAEAEIKNIAAKATSIVTDSIKKIKTTITDTTNIGDLAKSKFSGVDDLKITSSLEKKELLNSEAKQKQLEDKAVEESTLSLQEKAIKKVQIQLEPVQTSQDIISAITTVN